MAWLAGEKATVRCLSFNSALNYKAVDLLFARNQKQMIRIMNGSGFRVSCSLEALHGHRFKNLNIQKSSSINHRSALYQKLIFDVQNQNHSQ